MGVFVVLLRDTGARVVPEPECVLNGCRSASVHNRLLYGDVVMDKNEGGPVTTTTTLKPTVLSEILALQTIVVYLKMTGSELK